MKSRMMMLALVGLSVGLLAGCREKPKDEVDDDVTSDVSGGDAADPDYVPREITGNERWIQPLGTAKITFFVDDRANQTFGDGDMVWTGSWAWDEDDNTIVFSAAWGPQDGPYPLLYDDGPVSQGGHEMAGAEAGDHIFSTEVYFKAEEDTEFSYGVLNELGFWMWEGANGFITFLKGSTETVNADGQVLMAFGAVDIKVTIDLGKINPSFSYVEEWETVNVYMKGSMNMWTPVQILDMGPDIDKGDDVADDGIYTYVQSKNLGKHTGLLGKDQHTQFTFVFGEPETSVETAPEYKILTEGTQKGAQEGVTAYLSCDGGETWTETEILWEKDSWGSTDNTTVVAKCDGEPPQPDCTTDEECDEGEKCIDEECVEWCDLDEGCLDGEKCIDTKCLVWCDLDDDCDEGEQCIENQCQEVVVVSEPQITSLQPDSGPIEGGTLVTISGTGFMDGASVTFESLAAGNVVVKSSSEIECTSPAGPAGKADVTVTNPDSGADTYINAFNYLETAAAPVIDSVDPQEGPVTGGTEVYLTGQNFLPNPTVLFDGTMAAAVDFVSSTSVVATTPPGDLGLISVTIVNSDTQEDTLSDAFTYVPNSVDYIKLLAPTSITSFVDASAETVLVEIWEPGITGGEGAGPGLTVEFGFGPAATDLPGNPGQFSWMDAQYSGESGNNDIWSYVPVSDVAGTFGYTFRASVDGTNWVYADSTGNADGFDGNALGTWQNMEVGNGPVIFFVVPKGVSVLGGDTVTISGANFVAGAEVKLGDVTVVPDNVTDDTITFTAPAHAAGAVDMTVENPDSEVFVKVDGLLFLQKMTPVLDGLVDEWTTAFQVADNSVESDWGVAQNHLDTLSLAYDEEYLYIAVAGAVEPTNYILGYVDIDYPQQTGVSGMTMLSDNTGDGDLDDALSNVLAVDEPGFGAEFAFGSNGMESFAMGSSLSESLNVGWRELAPVDDFDWLDGSVIADTAIEAAIPLTALYGDELPSGAKQIAVFIKLSNSYGGFDGLSNQTLPEYFDEDAPEIIGSVAVLDVLFQ